MPEEKKHPITPYRGGVFQDLAMRIKLILRLLADRRVSPILKLIPVGSLVYLIFPDIAPGPIDDAAIIWLGLYLFVELCPPDVVDEHMASMTRTLPGKWREEPETAKNTGDVIEGTFRDEGEEEPAPAAKADEPTGSE